LLVGYSNLVASVNVNHNVSDNSPIRISNSTIIAYSLGTAGNAYGVNIGKGGATTSDDNELSVNNSILNVTANSRDAYGIWMLVGSGTLEDPTENYFYVNGVDVEEP